MLVDGIRSTDAHVKKHHPLSLAHSPTPAASGLAVYVVCGWGGCAQRLKMDAAVWEAETRRRREALLQGPRGETPPPATGQPVAPAAGSTKSGDT